MIIDCDRCEVRGIACDDCVVSVLLAAPPALDRGNIEWGEDETGALRALAAGGLVPPVRMSDTELHDAELHDTGLHNPGLHNTGRGETAGPASAAG